MRHTGSSSPPPATSPPTQPVRPWLDLATNQAGAEAREQAQAARDAAPVKTVLARVLGVHTDERAWRIGADGEEKVAAQLAKAAKKDPRWRFLHAIPVGDRGSDIDHLIIGPGGVFTVNAKHHPKAKIWVGGNTFMVNGNRQPYIRNSRYEAARAAKLLTAACGFPVHVEGLIVTVNAADVVIKHATRRRPRHLAQQPRQVAPPPRRHPHPRDPGRHLRGSPPLHHLADLNRDTPIGGRWPRAACQYGSGHRVHRFAGLNGPL